LVADWYNFIIQHNPTPRGFENGAGNAYINPLRDSSQHGRIYRISYKGGKDSKTLDLKDASNSELIEALKSENMFWRLTAQRLIVEQQYTEVIPDLYKIITDQSVDNIGLNAPAVNALWTLHGLGQLDGSNKEASMLVEKALRHPSAAVRKNALRVLPSNQESLRAILGSGILDDSDFATRKFAFLALSEMPFSEDAAKTLLQTAEKLKMVRIRFCLRHCLRLSSPILLNLPSGIIQRHFKLQVMESFLLQTESAEVW